MSLAGLRSDVVIVACAVSAGIHGALVPRHFGEGTGAGVGFLAATVLLSALAVALTRYPANAVVLAAAAVVFAGLLAGYALAIGTGLPLLHPGREPVDGLAVFTKVVEAAGLLVSSSLLGWPAVAGRIRQPKGTTT